MKQNYLLIALVVIAIVIAAVVLMQGYQPSYPTTTTQPSAPTTQATPTTQVTPTTKVPTSANQTATANIVDYAFNPRTLTVQVGTAVTWTNQGAMTHTVTSDSGSELNSGNLATGQTYSHTFNTKGTFNYHCAIHTSMRATVIVQ